MFFILVISVSTTFGVVVEAPYQLHYDTLRSCNDAIVEVARQTIPETGTMMAFKCYAKA